MLSFLPSYQWWLFYIRIIYNHFTLFPLLLSIKKKTPAADMAGLILPSRHVIITSWITWSGWEQPYSICRFLTSFTERAGNRSIILTPISSCRSRSGWPGANAANLKPFIFKPGTKLPKPIISLLAFSSSAFSCSSSAGARNIYLFLPSRSSRFYSVYPAIYTEAQ